MSPSRVRGLFFLCLLVVLVVSGPAVPVDLTPAERNTDSLGSGTATVDLAGDPAADLRLDRGRFGTGVYYLRVPPVVADVSALDGRPQLTYKIRVPGLDYADSTARKLARDGTGRSRVTVRDRAFLPKMVTADSYRAEITVRVQSFETDQVITRRNVTIPVDR